MDDASHETRAVAKKKKALEYMKKSFPTNVNTALFQSTVALIVKRSRIDKGDKSMQSMDETLHDIFLEVSSSSSTSGTNSVHSPRAKNEKRFQLKNLRRDSFYCSAAMTTHSTCNATKASKRVSFAKVEIRQYETALEGEKHISQAGAQGQVTWSRSDYDSKGTNEPESRIEHVEKE
ncbi:predicted protein [Chaetoceros tenuissimus]|uniref:Uncharacterized protein n=1 Tax=Chaetoceros tenuissimus TaxID=426638 RepID=A0AAD3DAA3_9STRA|nr:predicted protein [Chaetoceros tenuissimus]